MQEILQKLFHGENLSVEEASSAMHSIMQGKVESEKVAAFLGVIRGKGETVEEIVGFAKAMRANAVSLPVKRTDLVDTCGTGGDGAQTFNISTANSFVIAAAGVGVVKHGNRSVSSRCGSADVLEELGVKIDLTPSDCAKAVDELGFCFLFAPLFHPAMKNVVPIRKALGVRTVFNLLGPLCNPAPVKNQIIGVYDRDWQKKLATVLLELGSTNVMLVTGADGLDEISISANTYVTHLQDGKITSYEIEPKDLGLECASIESLQGGDAKQNAAIIEGILQGSIQDGKRDIVLFNAAAALLVSNQAKSLIEGCELARELISSGKAYKVLEKVRAFA